MLEKRIRPCELPVDLDCEVFSVAGFKDPKIFIGRAIGRFLISQKIVTTECVRATDGRLSFRFYGKVSSPKIVGKIHRQLRKRTSISSYSC